MLYDCKDKAQALIFSGSYFFFKKVQLAQYSFSSEEAAIISTIMPIHDSRDHNL